MSRLSQRVVVPALLLPCFLAGCGRKTEEKEGANKSSKDRLVGTWSVKLELDEAKLQGLIKKRGTELGKSPDEIKKQFEKQKATFPNLKLTMTLNADGTFELIRQEDEEKDVDKGTWEITEEKDEVIKVKTTEKGSGTGGKKGSDEVRNLTLTLRNENEFEFETDDPHFQQVPFKTPIVFKRQ